MQSGPPDTPRVFGIGKALYDVSKSVEDFRNELVIQDRKTLVKSHVFALLINYFSNET